MRRHFTDEMIALFFPTARVVCQNRSHEDFLVSYRIGADVELHCVFDGHGGGNDQNTELSSKHVGLYLEKYFVHHLLHHLRGVAYEDQKAIRAAITLTFLETDEHLHASGAKCGSTCSCVLILPETVVLANLGDSQAYAFRDGRVQFATTPHTAVTEETRIRRAGGHVTGKRLNGIYLPSRSFGDFRAKTKNGKYTFPAPMGIVPDITFLERKQYDFVLLMSDGITDGIPSVAELETLVAQASGKDAIPQHLAEVATKSNGNDDLCCLLCQL